MENINENLTNWSNLLFLTAYLVILLGFVLLLAEVSLGRKDYLAVEGTRKPLANKLGDSGFLIFAMGTIMLVFSLVLRGLAAHRLPWGNLFEFLTLNVCGALIISLFLFHQPKWHLLLVFIAITVLILLFIAGKNLRTPNAPLVPALKSYWLGIHVSIISLGTGILMVAGIINILYLLKQYGINHKLMDKLPGALQLENMSYRAVVFAFPIYSIGIICGAIWAESAWGRFWNWDPKEVASFVTWVIYAGFLHAENTPGWKGKRAAIINVLGFISIIINLFVINFVAPGFHSYANG